MNSGDLVWRQLNEASAAIVAYPQISVHGSRVIALLDNGQFLRAFDLEMGALKWQHLLGANSSDIKLAQSRAFVAALSASQVYGFVGKERISSKWTANLDDKET